MTPPAERALDLDLHGLVRVRLLDAGPAERAAVERQLGLRREPARGTPDLTLRFVERLETGPLRLLGLEEAGFSDDAFLVLRTKHKARARVQVPLDAVGGPCEIVCERGLVAVPLLVPIVNLTALARGAVPLHAAAFEWRGRGVVVVGWSKGGKTETLLAFAREGARYLADEWCYLGADGSLAGLPEPVRLWHWQLAQLPEIRRRVPRAARLRLAALGLLPAGAARLPRRLSRSAPGRGLRRLAGLAQHHRHVLVPPRELFAGPPARLGRLERLLFVVSGEGPEVRARPVDPLEVAERVVHSLHYERRPLLEHYAMFRFAFPQRRNPHLEKAEECSRRLLERAFAQRPAHEVVHPYPVEIPRLFECIAPLLEAS
jgi:hypothetical protein